MKRFLTLALISSSLLWGRGDTLSGPGRTTIQNLSWGTLYYEPVKLGNCSLTSVQGDLVLTTREGRVVIKGSEANGFDLSLGPDRLTIRPLNGGGGIEVKGKMGTWTLRTSNGTATLSSSDPKDTVLFKRSANVFTIEGAKGTVVVTSEPGSLRIQSPLGTTTITTQYGDRIFKGPPLDRIPYLGQGIFIPFHGVGVFLDVTRVFPMPEVNEWLDWKPLLL